MAEEELGPMQRGYYRTAELKQLEALPPEDRVKKGRVAIIECIEEIPCNPCAYICRVDAIRKEALCKPPIVDWEKCTGCTICVSACPGLAIFCQRIADGKGTVTLPYELLPLPTRPSLMSEVTGAGSAC